MTIQEYNELLAHIEDYKIGDNQYKCPICNKVYHNLSYHIRKEHYNKENGIKNSGRK